MGYACKYEVYTHTLYQTSFVRIIVGVRYTTVHFCTHLRVCKRASLKCADSSNYAPSSSATARATSVIRHYYTIRTRVLYCRIVGNIIGEGGAFSALISFGSSNNKRASDTEALF